MTPFMMGTTSSTIMQSLGEIELRAPAVGAKIGVFSMSRLVCRAARGGHSSNKYCVTVYGSILMPFSAIFFQKGLLCHEHYMVLIYIARWRHNYYEIAVKNYEKSKNRRKSLCAPLRI